MLLSKVLEVCGLCLFIFVLWQFRVFCLCRGFFWGLCLVCFFLVCVFVCGFVLNLMVCLRSCLVSIKKYVNRLQECVTPLPWMQSLLQWLPIGLKMPDQADHF